jgi:hypothetical protein
MSAASWCRGALFAAVICFPLAARAQDAAADAAKPSAPEELSGAAAGTSDAERARSLFDQGRKLLEQNRTAEACALFARSQALESTIAALLNLGLCERQRGRLATALAYFKLAARASDEEGDGERAAKATSDAEEVARLAGTLSIRSVARTTGDTECLVDGVAVPRSTWSIPMPLDSGDHRVEVRRKAGVVATTVVVISDGSATVYEIPPAYDELPGASPSPSLLRKAAPGPRGVTSAPKPQHRLPVASYVAGGFGIASLGVALGFGAAAWAKYSEAEAQCTPDHHCSSRAPLSLYDSAVDDARVANIAAAVGGVALAAGVVFYFVYGRDRENPVPIRVSTGWVPGGGAAALRGAF